MVRQRKPKVREQPGRCECRFTFPDYPHEYQCEGIVGHPGDWHTSPTAIDAYGRRFYVTWEAEHC